MTASLVLFRRDLRLTDNTALNEAFRLGQPVLPMFVVDTGLLAKWQQATKRLSFLYRSVTNLEQSIRERGGRLLIGQGQPDVECARVLDAYAVSDVFVNREYTPLGMRRDEKLEELCQARGIRFHCLDDAVINAPAVVKKPDGKPYTVFTPYFRRAAAFPVAPPETLKGKFLATEGPCLDQIAAVQPFLNEIPEVSTQGPAPALARLSQLGDYATMRDVPASGQTSQLSTHIRFGTCSPREVHAAVWDQLGAEHPLIRQLYWRDFYTQIAWHFPHVFGRAFRPVYDAIEWRTDVSDLEKWQAGHTGFPIVDAGMRELKATGLMHNRVRMIVASFLTKNLQIDWRLGEKHFARHLIDYDPAVNNGNWQWGASTGCDAQPYFRVFNPWRQQLKFDKDCAYIKRWVPELEPYPAPAIHKLEREGDFYLPQIVDLRQSSEASKQAFKSVNTSSV